MSPFAWLLTLPVHAYRLFVSPFLGRNCRFAPSCSEYALEALRRHGALKGGWLALRRISRCHPWGGHGHDPVPPAPVPPTKPVPPAKDESPAEGVNRTK